MPIRKVKVLIKNKFYLGVFCHLLTERYHFQIQQRTFGAARRSARSQKGA